MIVLFDLPTETSEQRHAYINFRKWLKMDGYMMWQYSIYVKSIRNLSMAPKEYEKLRKNAPLSGDIKAWHVSERNFRSIQQIRGKAFNAGLLCDKFIVFE